MVSAEQAVEELRRKAQERAEVERAKRAAEEAERARQERLRKAGTQQ